MLSMILVLFMAGGQPPPEASDPPAVPIFREWTVVRTVDLDIKISDEIVVFLGQIVEYRNPADGNEYGSVINRHAVVMSVRRSIAEKTPNSAGIDLTKYQRKREIDALNIVRKNADAVAYRHWRTAVDLATGRDVLVGAVQTWLRGMNMVWVYSNNEQLTRENISEPMLADGVMQDASKLGAVTVVVGHKFSLAGSYHVLRIDPVMYFRAVQLISGKGKK